MVTATDGRERRVDARRNLASIVVAAAEVLAERPRASMQEIADAATTMPARLRRASTRRSRPSVTPSMSTGDASANGGV